MHVRQFGACAGVAVIAEFRNYQMQVGEGCYVFIVLSVGIALTVKENYQGTKVAKQWHQVLPFRTQSRRGMRKPAGPRSQRGKFWRTQLRGKPGGQRQNVE